MKKINEFINNDNLKDDFYKLKNDLYYETAHLSSLHQIKDSISYKKILSLGNYILPLLIDEIKNNESLTFCLLLIDLAKPDIEINKNESGKIYKLRENILNWWVIMESKE